MTDKPTYQRVMPPMEKAVPVPMTDAQRHGAIQDMIKLGLTRNEANKAFRQNIDKPAYKNDLYTVHVNNDTMYLSDDPDAQPIPIVHLSIKRNDRKPAKDWRHFQQIKNDICGPEFEAVEIYPAESRLVDTANQYHIWVFPEGQQIPIGFHAGRRVTNTTHKASGAVQTPYPETT